MERIIKVSAAVTARQRSASDPRASAWVRANAGSGKTHVLTERVMRLLLTGVRPEEILCLTYTKAAAAEMRRRVSARLAAWALMPEAELVAGLTELEGEAPSREVLQRARTLFAHALETPGGLKINTIHAFCEAVLHRFPLEAGVPFDFAVVEDVEAEALIRQSREAVIAEGLRGATDVSAAVETLFGLLSDHSLTLAIDEALAEGRKLRRVLADIPAAKARLRAIAQCPPSESRAALLRRVSEETLLGRDLLDRLFALMPPERGRMKRLRFVDLLWQRRAHLHVAEVWLSVFLKDDGTGYADRRTKGIKDELLADAIGREHDRLAELSACLRRAALVERSEALLDLLAAILGRYESQKRARSWLDFDDLVERLGDLFARSGQADWVRYKLDAGITHILVDESQDTNPEQWRVIEELQGEFFAGAGAIDRLRTVFGVGDEKQSIFSFQGAEPRLFGDFGRRFGGAARAAGKRFEPVRLDASFRTLPGILEAVDRVFAAPRLRDAIVGAPGAGEVPEAVAHETVRAEGGGQVVLWPLLKDERGSATGEQWPRSVEDVPNQLKSAPRRLAERIAGEIRVWLDDRRALGTRGRAVQAEDILILVQQRSALFTELIRALGLRGIATPGADRLPVTTHIAVLDLLALGDVLINTADDLQLAAVLRSPLFDISEQHLFDIAAGREHSLWRSLGASPLPEAREAFARLQEWRSQLDFGRPFEFYADILYRDGGLRRLHGRMGGEIDDVMVEFLELALAHEQTASPSLQGFLAEMRAQDISIKRDLAEPGRGVRVMTVHGAKGLEAPIVILADAASKPAPSLLPRVFFAAEGDPPVFIHASGKDSHTDRTIAFRSAVEAATQAEYWRKLYVGMTRAEDELYITGYLTKQGKPDGSWYEAAEVALGDAARRIEAADGRLEALVFPAAAPSAATGVVAGSSGTGRPQPVVLPPLAAPVIVPVVRPSSASEDGEATMRPLASAIDAVLTAEESRQEGIALHAILQHLDRVAPVDHAAAVEKALPILLPRATSERRELVGARALSIRHRPEFAEFFGPASRAEVPFLLAARRHGKPVQLAGRIDRVVVAKHGILVIDYKSDARPPGTASGVPASYRTQVGLYAYVASQLFPGLAVQAGILWTSLESLMILPSPVLRDAASAFTMR